MRHHAVSIAALAAFSLAPGLAYAQAEATKTPVPYNQVLSTNPIGLPFLWFNGEYERKLEGATTWGVSAAFLQDAEYSNTRLVLRYYPQRAAFDGFYVGGHAGVFHAGHARNNSLGAGVEIGHAWLLGPNRNVSVSIGFGATRLFGHDWYDGPVVLPTPRLVNVGIAF